MLLIVFLSGASTFAFLQLKREAGLVFRVMMEVDILLKNLFILLKFYSISVMLERWCLPGGVWDAVDDSSGCREEQDSSSEHLNFSLLIYFIGNKTFVTSPPSFLVLYVLMFIIFFIDV